MDKLPSESQESGIPSINEDSYLSETSIHQLELDENIVQHDGELNTNCGEKEKATPGFGLQTVDKKEFLAKEIMKTGKLFKELHANGSIEGVTVCTSVQSTLNDYGSLDPLGVIELKDVRSSEPIAEPSTSDSSNLDGERESKENFQKWDDRLELQKTINRCLSDMFLEIQQDGDTIKILEDPQAWTKMLDTNGSSDVISNGQSFRKVLVFSQDSGENSDDDFWPAHVSDTPTGARTPMSSPELDPDLRNEVVNPGDALYLCRRIAMTCLRIESSAPQIAVVFQKVAPLVPPSSAVVWKQMADSVQRLGNMATHIVTVNEQLDSLSRGQQLTLQLFNRARHFIVTTCNKMAMVGEILKKDLEHCKSEVAAMSSKLHGIHSQIEMTLRYMNYMMKTIGTSSRELQELIIKPHEIIISVPTHYDNIPQMVSVISVTPTQVNTKWTRCWTVTKCFLWLAAFVGLIYTYTLISEKIQQRNRTTY